MSEHRPSAEECLTDIAAAGWAGHVAEIRMALAEADHDYRQLEADKDAEIARLRSLLKPMADMADYYDSLGYEDRAFVACVNNHGEYIGIKIGDLYAARKEVRGE